MRICDDATSSFAIHDIPSSSHPKQPKVATLAPATAAQLQIRLLRSPRWNVPGEQRRGQAGRWTRLRWRRYRPSQERATTTAATAMAAGR